MPDPPTYWLPTWWSAVDDWRDCQTCLAYNGTPCASCEVPPGLLALAQLVGGGTAAVAGIPRGNITINSAQQAQAARRTAPDRVVDVAIQKNQADRLRQRKSDLATRGPQR